MPATMTLKAAHEAGKVSTRNSKMPGSAFAVDPFACPTGKKLVDVKGSTCSGCYAIRLAKIRPSVRQGYIANLEKALSGIAANPESWARAMAYQIDKAARDTGEPFHRWFDSGDLQSVAMLEAICRVAELTPHVSHWLPTREAAMFARWLKAGNRLPVNLIVRVSAPMVNDAPLRAFEHTSTVATKKGGNVTGSLCEASTRGNSCGPCRACWDKTIPNVTYPKH